MIEARNREKLRDIAWQVVVILLASSSIGILVGLISSLFVQGVKFLTQLRSESSDFLAFSFGFNLSIGPMLYLICAAFLLIGLRSLFGVTRWHGPADSIYSAHRVDNNLDLKQGFAATIAAFVSISGGAPVGQYGPLVHFGATIGAGIQKFSRSHRIGVDVFIGCGVAAAISAGFHAPIAGIIFAHEVVLRHFSFRAVTPIAIASITGEWFASSIFGGSPMFALEAEKPDLLPMIFPLLLSGLVFGAVAILFMKALMNSARIATASHIKPAYLIFGAAATCGFIGMFVPAILGTGTEEIKIIIQEDYSMSFLVLIFLLKLLLTSLAIGWGLFGGVFSPAVFIGASAGGIVAKLLTFFGLTVVPHLFPIAGFAAVTAAVVGAPISLVIIVLELTQSYEFAVAAMVAAVVSTFLTSLVFGHSLFDAQLAGRSIDLSQGRGSIQLNALSIVTIVSGNFVSLSPELRVDEAIKAMAQANSSEGYCVGADGSLLGKANLQKLILEDDDRLLTECVERNPLSINEDASVLQAIEIASGFIGESIPVLEPKSRKILGVVSEADIFEAYLGTQKKANDLEHN